MSRLKPITSPNAPAAIGPYSQAIQVDGWVYGSGQIPLDPTTGERVGDGNVAKQAEQVFDNIEAVLAAAGGTLADVVKVTVYMVDLDQFIAMNSVYAKRFGDHKPARAAVQVTRLPKDALVEIDFTARLTS